jgi:hypothetical protein
MSDTHCEHCPFGEGHLCPGERNRRACAKVDPASPIYRRGFDEALLRMPGFGTNPENPPFDGPDPGLDLFPDLKVSRDDKPRVRLGVDQHKMPPPGCKTCSEKEPAGPA